MATIKNLTLKSFDNGQFKQLYYQVNVVVQPTIGNTSDVYFVMSRENLKVHVKNAVLEETLSSVEDIENDTASWEYITDSVTSPFTLPSGVSFLRITNTSATEVATLSVTGV